MDQNQQVYGETVQSSYSKVPPGVRPYTAPDETGFVDVSKYPEPVDSTKKIRGTSELLETLVGGLEPELVTAKVCLFMCTFLIQIVHNLYEIATMNQGPPTRGISAGSLSLRVGGVIARL